MKSIHPAALCIAALLTSTPAIAEPRRGEPLILPNEQQRDRAARERRDEPPSKDATDGSHCIPPSPPPGRQRRAGAAADCSPGSMPEGMSGQPGGAAVSTPEMGQGRSQE